MRNGNWVRDDSTDVGGKYTAQQRPRIVESCLPFPVLFRREGNPTAR